MQSEIVKASKGSVSAGNGGPILPAIIAEAGDHAATTLHRVLHRHHPQRQHAAGLRQGGRRFPRLVPAQRPDPARHRAGTRRRLHRAAHPLQSRPDRQAAPRRHRHAVRLADQRRHPALQPGRVGSRPEARRQTRQDAGADRQEKPADLLDSIAVYEIDERRSPIPPADPDRPTRPGLDRRHGLQLRPRQCRPRHAGGGLLHRRPQGVVPAA